MTGTVQARSQHRPGPRTHRARPPWRHADASRARVRVRRTVRLVARRHGVDPRLALAISWQESGWQQRRGSSAGAIGAMQVLPGTGRWMSLHVDRPLNLYGLHDNVTAGAVLFQVLRAQTGGAVHRRLPPGSGRAEAARCPSLEPEVRARRRCPLPPAAAGTGPGLTAGLATPNAVVDGSGGSGGPTLRRDAGALPPPADHTHRRTVVVDRTVTDPMIGRVLDGRYRVGARIARGGMATVYEATDLRLDRVVAVKVMHAGLGDDDDFADRLVREARSAARLSHPHVVGVFDQGADDGTLFLVMEHVDGHTLRDVLRSEAPLPPSRALALLDPVLSALGAAHRAGLVHRDVKPENVLLADDGRVKVADFGLARAVSAETQHTTTGILIGTVSYLAPELLVDGRADARSDVYSAGVLLHEMLTGRKPHEAASPIQVAYKHVHEDVPPPSRLVPGLPPYVDALVARATARDRDLRPADASVLLRHVRRVRVALDHGVLDDAELTSDLTPTVPVQRLGRAADDIDYVREDPAGDDDTGDLPTVLTPAQAAGRRSRSRGDRLSRRRHLRRGPGALALALLLVLAVAAGGWWLGAGRYTTTPGVLNLSARAAQAEVEAAGLGWRVDGRAYSETVAVGAVVSTDPSGGDAVVRDGTVSAVLSRGPERHQVPAVTSRVLDEAQQALQDARLTVGDASYAFSDTVARGVVMETDPRPGTSLRRGAAVDLVVSKGPRPVRVPDVSGDDADDATRVLRRLRLEVARSSAHSDTVARGDVVSQTPREGRLLPGRTVRLLVSKGPVLVAVPRVVGRSTTDAQAALTAAGFSVSVTQVEYYIGLGVVVRQSPGGGDRAPRGSTVTLSVV